MPLPPEIPIYEIDPAGHPSRLALLRPQRRGFTVESDAPVAGEYDGLPWFLQGMRPSGFLGRLRARDTGVLQEIREWSAEATVSWLLAHGWDTTGNLILGDEALQRLTPEWNLQHFGQLHEDHLSFSTPTHARYYPLIVDLLLQSGPHGSSAAGEQPKFLTSRDAQPVLVKFSPPLDTATGRRVAELLICESIALGLIREIGGEGSAAKVETLRASDRLFLEVERFDRLPGGGRRGVASLEAISMEFSGGLSSWSETTADLLAQGILIPNLRDSQCSRQSSAAQPPCLERHESRRFGMLLS